MINKRNLMGLPKIVIVMAVLLGSFSTINVQAAVGDFYNQTTNVKFLRADLAADSTLANKLQDQMDAGNTVIKEINTGKYLDYGKASVAFLGAIGNYVDASTALGQAITSGKTNATKEILDAYTQQTGDYSLAVSSISAISSNSFKVIFNKKPIDISKVSLTVTRAGTAVTLTTTWNAASTEATVTSSANLPLGAYSVNIKNGTTDLGTSNITIVDHKIAKINITTSKLVVTSTTLSGITTQVGKATYQILDQYGNDITNTSFNNNLEFKTGVGNIVAEKGVLTVTPVTGLNLFAFTSGVVINGKDTNSGISTNATLIAVDNAAIANSRQNPANLGDMINLTTTTYDEKTFQSEVIVKDIIRGDGALSLIKNANMYNDVPKDGYEYMLAKISFKLVKASNINSQFNLSGYNFKMVSSSGKDYDSVSVVVPNPNLDSNLYQGASSEGYAVFQVLKTDSKPLITYGRNYDGTGGIWFKGYADGTTVTN
ncbi:hypothetical protein K2F43_20600 [Clostridium estertheticum]|uniref:hypothetical protein n=1 Tax=Clostridium estertheticum TaxID=238834 RepID=UPI001C6F3E9F|nr:hypothetical protein [Clostridium estertheticum]MBW9173590.1 hypothetical protein [Clostridium estertheticum]WLC75223.1 hypothetical protein KTC99_21320 [Clostridium estertheticum]